MALEIVYYPPPGDKDSPDTYIQGLPDEEQALLQTWLETFADTPPGEWKSRKSKKVTEHLWQHDRWPHRLLFVARAGKLVVLHAFLKGSDREQKAAYRLAEQRYEEYTGSN